MSMMTAQQRMDYADNASERLNTAMMYLTGLVGIITGFAVFRAALPSVSLEEAREAIVPFLKVALAGYAILGLGFVYYFRMWVVAMRAAAR